jgi:AcrR family transcriptional regulator
VTNAPNGKGERTRARLIEAAVERFGAGGFRSTSVAAIAREAGVSPAASFSYWASKEALFEAALDHDAGAVIVELLQMISGPGASSGELISVDLDRWLRLIDDLLAVLESHPLCRRVLAGQEPDFVDGLLRLPVFDGLREVIVTAIEAEQRSGVTRPDLDPRRAAVGIETITLALAMTMLRLQDPPGDDRRAGVAEILLAAFRPPS